MGPNKKYWEAQEGSERDKMEIRIISLKASKIYHCTQTNIKLGDGILY